jgi:protein-disulfide isomerase
LEVLRERYPTQVTVIYRHFPLTYSHPYALQAAIASECAAKEGHFKPYHDALFATADSLGTVGWSVLAVRAGIADTISFGSCVRGQQTIKIVQEDIRVGRSLGVRATPTFFINGKRVVGAITADSMLVIVSMLVAEHKSGIMR